MHASGKKNQWWQCLIEFIKFGKKGNKGAGWLCYLQTHLEQEESVIQILGKG